MKNAMFPIMVGICQSPNCFMVEIAMSKVRDAAKSRGRQAATRRRMLDVGGASAVGTSVTHGKS